MLNSDPEFELLCEIDRWRFVAFVMLELQIKHSIPLNEEYLRRKGFDLKKRPISLTMQMLQKSNLICKEPCQNRNVDKDKEEDKEEDNKKCVTEKTVTPYLSDEDFIEDLKKTYDYVDVDNQLVKMEKWLSLRPGRKLTRRFIINWLNKIDKPLKTVASPKNEALEKIKEWQKEKQKQPLDCEGVPMDSVKGKVSIGNLVKETADKLPTP